MPTTDTDERRVADRYVLKRRLGSGGMGVVWEAFDEVLARRVAIKEVELPPSVVGVERAKFAARVLREARAAARLTHPGVVTLYDVIREQGTTFIVMELVEAPPLSALVLEDGPLPPEQAAGIGSQVLAALEAAHGRGIVHRDIKPGNVLVLPNGQTKLTDFGIATLHGDPQLTATGMVLGSPGYMAPEQASGATSGPAADLYGLGATLYYAVEGQAPFEKGGAIQTMTAVVTEEPRPMRRSGPLAPVIARLMAKDPDQRPTSAEARRLLGKVAAELGSGAPARPGTGKGAPAAPAVAAGAAAGAQVGAAREQGKGRGQGDEQQDQQAQGQGQAQRPGSRQEPSHEPGREPGHQPGREPGQGPGQVPGPVAGQEPGPKRVSAGAEAGLAERAASTVRVAGGQVWRARRARPLAALGALLLVVAAVAGAMIATRAGDGTASRGPGGVAAPTTASPGGTSEPTRAPATTAAPTSAPSGAGGAPVIPEGWRRYRGPGGVYRLAYPRDWTVRRRGGRIVDFVQPGGGTYLRVDWTDRPQDPVENWRTYERQFAATHAGYQRLRLEPATFQGMRGAAWEYRYRTGGRLVHAVNITFIAPSGRLAYAFNFQTREEDWAGAAGLRAELQRQFRAAGSPGS